MSKNGERTAFAVAGKLTEDEYVCEPGLGKREFFAAMAMQGLCVSLIELRRTGFRDSDIERFALERADGLLAALEGDDD